MAIIELVVVVIFELVGVVGFAMITGSVFSVLSIIDNELFSFFLPQAEETNTSSNANAKLSNLYFIFLFISFIFNTSLINELHFFYFQ